LCSLEETQSLWSEISAAAVTLPLPAVAPTQLRARLPGSSTLLVSWQSGLLNDCEFVESTVEGQVVGDTTWFQPAGCTSLTLINAYHCTAEGLTTNTQYVFRVRTSCADPQSSSAWSVSSLAESTLSSVQAWESNQRRLISVNIASDLDYNTVISNAEAFKSSISSETSLSLGLTAANVEVEIMASTAPTPARRLAAISAVFAVIIEGATQSESETSAQVVAGVATAVQAETGSTSTFNVTSTSLTAATAPEKISWTFMEDGQLHLQWNPLPLGDCSFLAWHVLVKVGGSGSSSPVAGCTSLSNLSHTSCIAKGLDESNSNTFTVAVLCANPAVNSMFSEASDPWPSAPSLDCDFLATLSLVGAPQVSQQFAEEVKLEVVPVLSTCAGNTDIRLNTVWQYQSGTIFVSLQEAELLDSSPLPNTLLLKAFTLLPGSHQFRAVLQDGNDKQLDSKLFTVVVTDSAPNFIITGATAVGVGCGIELGSSVSGSFHPDVSMSHRWICLQPADCNSTISNFVSGGNSSERLVIGSNEAVLGSYQFRVTVTKQYGGAVAHLPSISAHTEVTVSVEESGPLPVEIISPWTSGRISQQATSLDSPLVARVGTANEGCQVPDSAVFAWVVAAEADDRIVASVDAQVSRSSSGFVRVTTTSFPGLSPSSYIYAILRANTAETLAAGTASQTLQDAAALGISITKSMPFTVDAVPSPGQIEIAPVQGKALKTSFTFSTNGWSDEDATSLQYAFFVFPIADSYNITLGDDGQLQSTPEFQIPKIDFDDPASTLFWSKMKGLMLRTFGTVSNSESRLSNKAFYTVVRARDTLGGVASVATLGPLVEMANVSAEDLTNSLAESQNSGDPSRILASVQVVMSLSSGGTDTDGSVAVAALDALSSLTAIVEGDDETLQQLGTSISQVVFTGTLDTESLKKAADVLESCLDLALTGDGLSTAVGESILGGIVSIGQTTSTEVAAEAKSVSTKLVSLISDLGVAALQSLEEGATKEINSLDESGSGIKVAVTKPSAEATTSGLELKQLSILPEAFSGRRLDQSDACGNLSTVQVTEWLKSNPFSYAEIVVGTSASIAPKADVLSVEINYCNLIALRHPISVTLPLPNSGETDAIPTCARFETAEDSWVIRDVTTVVDTTAGTVRCSSTRTMSSYTVFLNNDKNESSVGDVSTTDEQEMNHSPGSFTSSIALGCLLLFWLSA